MENIDLTQMVHDRRTEREGDAHDHRMAHDTEQPAKGQPRLRYKRRYRPQTVPAAGRESRAGG